MRMKNNDYIAIGIFLGVVALFAVIMFFASKVRTNIQKESAAVKASDLLPGLFDLSDPADFLYAVWHDLSNTVIGLIVKDAEDREIAKISFQNIKGVTIEMPEEAYSIDYFPLTKAHELVLRRSKDSKSLCSCRETFFRKRYFCSTEIGTFEMSRLRSFSKGGVIPIRKNGNIIGNIRPLNAVCNRGRGKVLILSHAIPLPIRLFILALGRIDS